MHLTLCYGECQKEQTLHDCKCEYLVGHVRSDYDSRLAPQKWGEAFKLSTETFECEGTLKYLKARSTCTKTLRWLDVKKDLEHQFTSAKDTIAAKNLESSIGSIGVVYAHLEHLEPHDASRLVDICNKSIQLNVLFSLVTWDYDSPPEFLYAHSMARLIDPSLVFIFPRTP